MDFRLSPADLSDLDGRDDLLQSGFWGRFKSVFGWEARAFRVYSDPVLTGGQGGQGTGNKADSAGQPTDSGYAGLLVLLRPLGAGFFLAYVPMGPPEGLITPGDWDGLALLAARLKSLLPAGTVFIRFDPPWAGSAEEQTGDRRHPPDWRRAPMDIQPPSTVILDLNGSEEAILAQMKKKNRYNINLAFKKGVTVREAGLEELPVWYEIYRETAARDKIALHQYGYYEKLFQLAADETSRRPELKLYLADIEGRPEAGIIVARQGRVSTYLYGASTNNKRNYMPAYALQWTAIRDAKAAGCTAYDFYGIPPTDDPDHPMAGLYRFKTGFGGGVVHRPGSWDYPYRPVFYRAYRLAETLRNWYYRKFKKRR